MPKHRPALTRFMEKVDVKPSGCWEWTAYRTKLGYGRFGPTHDNVMLAHRWSYEQFVGPIPNGLQIDHLCRNPPCVNPAHLEPVDHQENMRRGILGVLTTHCPQGHPYDEKNTYLYRNKNRKCRTCLRERHVEWTKKNPTGRAGGLKRVRDRSKKRRDVA